MDATPGDGALETFLPAVITAGIAMVQLRERRLNDGDLVAVARRCAGLCKAGGVPFIINDRPDIALLCDADGVHVGQDDLSVGDVRSLVGSGRIVGLSTHSPDQVEAARASGADYIGVGPVHATPTKKGRPAVGLDLVRYAAAHAAQPFFAIGGIDPSNIRSVSAAGASSVSVLRWVTRAVDPPSAVTQLLAAMDAARRRPAAS